jgi:hypothetical protein
MNKIITYIKYNKKMLINLALLLIVIIGIIIGIKIFVTGL